MPPPSDPQRSGASGEVRASRARTSYLVKRLQHALYLRMESTLAPFELTATQYTVLSILGHRRDQSSAQLARRFAVTPQTMIKLVASLEAKGLISRAEGDEDRRRLVVSLTRAGRRVLEACEAAIDAMETEAFSALGEDRLAGLRSLLLATLDGMRPGQDLPQDSAAGKVGAQATAKE
jgi:DNA-binding MarR family transcriptional regulator